jgi:NIMA (never in mitosis gene a)-related kinase
MKALRDLKILHRDIKRANVFLFEDGMIKLGYINDSKMRCKMGKAQSGTQYYASPEVWKDQPFEKSDCWSLGCIIYAGVALKPPFRANNMERLFKKVTYPYVPPEHSQEVSILLKMMLQVIPQCNCNLIL